MSAPRTSSPSSKDAPTIQSAPGETHGQAVRNLQAPRYETADELRAANLAWNAAGDYSFEPAHLFFDAQGSPLLYENTATGLIRRWFDYTRIRAMAESWAEDYRAADFDNVLWTAFEEAACTREAPLRPALKELHADFLNGLDAQARDILNRLSEPSPIHALDQPEIEARVRNALQSLYGFDGRIVKPVDAKLHLGVALLAPLLRDKVDGRVRGRYAANTGDGRMIAVKRGQHGALARAREKRALDREAADRDAIREDFGPSLLSESKLSKLEAAVCTGNHADCKLWIVDGNQHVGSTDTREGRAMLGASAEQVQRNAAFFQRNRRLLDSAAVRLAHGLRDRLESDDAVWQRRQRFGMLDAGGAWRADALGDGRIFKRKASLDKPSLSVWLLLDASGSRSDDAAVIAAQAWMLAQGLRRAGVEVRIRSFSSLHGYTVIRRFGFSADGGFRSIFHYFAFGMNRDGLALRTIGETARNAQRATGKRSLVLVLTDGAPMDDAPFPAEAEHGRAKREYVGHAAVQDTAEEVRALRKEGISVAALYHGEDGMLADAKRMYGDQVARVRSLSHLADTATALIVSETQRR